MLPDPDLIRTWLFGPGADAPTHAAMTACASDALIADLEDSTPAARREEARRLLPALMKTWRSAGKVACVRINQLDADGPADLEAAMRAGAQVILHPMAARTAQMQALDAAIGAWEKKLDIAAGTTAIVPVCETALGVLDVRAIAAGSPRIRSALLGTEDLASDLCAERSAEGTELDHARRRFLLECRAIGVEPIDAPYTFADTNDAVREARYARRLGYRCKSVVLPHHAAPINAALTPSDEELQRARAMVSAFEAARARGEDRALVDGLWVEVPTWRNAVRLIERARRLSAAHPA